MLPCNIDKLLVNSIISHVDFPCILHLWNLKIALRGNKYAIVYFSLVCRFTDLFYMQKSSFHVYNTETVFIFKKE